MERCDPCPLAAGTPCPSRSNPRLCVMVGREAGQADPRQLYWARIVRELAGATAPEAGPPEPSPAPSLARFDAAAYQGARLLILGCDYRGPATTGSCGCAELRVCFAGKGREGTVVPADCRACVTGGQA